MQSTPRVRIILDLELGEQTARDLLRAFGVDGVTVPVVVIAGSGSIEPQSTPAPQLAESPSYAAARWAKAVIGLLDASRDVRTLDEWAQEIGASTGTLRNWCRVARLSPRRSLLLGRLLRAAHVSGGRPWKPEQLLNISDLRTLHKLLASAGLPRNGHEVRSTDILANQRLIQDERAKTALAAALAAHSEAGSPPAR